MIRYAKHQNKDYIVVNSSIKLNDTLVPVQIQVNVTSVKEEDRYRLFRICSAAFHRVLDFEKPKSQVKKPWWKIW